MRNGRWLGISVCFQLFLRPASTQPFMHLNDVPSHLPFMFDLNFGFCHSPPSIPVTQVVLLLLPSRTGYTRPLCSSLPIPVSPTQEHISGCEITTIIGTTLPFKAQILISHYAVEVLVQTLPLPAGHSLGQVTWLTWASIFSVKCPWHVGWMPSMSKSKFAGDYLREQLRASKASESKPGISSRQT